MSRAINIIIGIVLAAILAGVGVFIYLNTGFAKQGDSILERDLEKWQKAVEDNPGSGLAHANLAATYVDLDKQEEAIKEYRQALELQPEEYTFMLRLGVVLRKSGKLNDAIDMFGQAAERSPAGEKYAGLHQIAEIYHERGDNFLAKDYVQQSINDDDLIWNSHYLLGKIYEEEEDNAKAGEEYQKAVKFNTADPDLEEALKRVSP
ncbi:MAG: tetratricopeptide repeat protein [Thermoleophilia bacterium]